MPTPAAAVSRYEHAIDRLPNVPTSDEIRRELAGKDLVCWCPPGHPCHADVLMRVANDPV